MSYSISVYPVYAFFSGRIQLLQGGALMQMLGYKGWGGTHSDLELKVLDLEMRWGNPIFQSDSYSEGVKSPLFSFFSFFSFLKQKEKQILILFSGLTGLSCSKILITFEFLFVEVMVL